MMVRNAAILMLVFIGGTLCAVGLHMVAPGSGYDWFGHAVTFWLLAAVYGWLTRVRRPRG